MSLFTSRSVTLAALAVSSTAAVGYLVRWWMRRCERAAVTLVLEAAVYSARRHCDHTTRPSSPSEPYINHNLRVGLTLAVAGAPLSAIVAGVLHNVIIDTGDTEERLSYFFDPSIANIVSSVHDEDAKYNDAVTLDREARLVLLADYMENLMDLAKATPDGWDAERVHRCFASADQVVCSVRGTSLKLERAYDDALLLRNVAVKKATG